VVEKGSEQEKDKIIAKGRGSAKEKEGEDF